MAPYQAEHNRRADRGGAHARPPRSAMPETPGVHLAMDGSLRLTVYPLPVKELMRFAGGRVVDDDNSIYDRGFDVSWDTKRYGKTEVVGRPGIGHGEKRICRCGFEETHGRVDGVEAVLQETDRAGVISIREDGAATDRPVMSALLLEGSISVG